MYAEEKTCENVLSPVTNNSCEIIGNMFTHIQQKWID